MENKIVGYKKYFGFVLPDWVDEKQVSTTVGYVLVALVMTFILMLVVTPNREKVETSKNQLSTAQGNLDKLKGSRDSLSKAGDTIEPLLQYVFMAMPTSYSPDEAIYQLRRVAQASEVKLVEYSLPAGVIMDEEKTPSATQTDGKGAIRFQSFPVSITVSGSIASILNFINTIEKSLPIGFVSDLNIRELTEMSRKATTKETSLKLEITYYQPLPLRTFNLTYLEQLTTTDLDLATELSSYTTSSGPEIDTNPVNVPTEQSLNANLFGL